MELIVRDLSLVWTKFDNSHLNEKSPGPTAEQTNVMLPYTLATTLFGRTVTFGGYTIKITVLVANTLRVHIEAVQYEEYLALLHCVQTYYVN